MLLTYKYRIYPSYAQRTRLSQTLRLCCDLFNAALQERRDAYRLERKSVSYQEQQNQLPDIKEIRPELKEIHSQVLQDVLRRLDKAFQSFFRRIKERKEKAGFPRFRPHQRYDSLTYTQSGFALKEGKLHLSKIGKVKIKLHRPLTGVIKTLTIMRSATGKWYACFSVEVEPELQAVNTQAVGVDVGLLHFATLSTGEHVPNPRFFRADEDELAKAQRKLSLEKKGTPERIKRRKIVARIHERIAQRRRDFAHQESRKLVKRFGVIIFEKLNIKGMLGNHRFAKSITDAAWRQLIQCTLYKAAYAGGVCGEVETSGTSKLTSCCGVSVVMTLSDRVINCPKCHAARDRDFNASLNILSRGLATLGLNAIEAASL